MQIERLTALERRYSHPKLSLLKILSLLVSKPGLRRHKLYPQAEHMGDAPVLAPAQVPAGLLKDTSGGTSQSPLLAPSTCGHKPPGLTRGTDPSIPVLTYLETCSSCPFGGCSPQLCPCPQVVGLQGASRPPRQSS